MNSTLKITFIYLAVGIVWIFVSDRAALLFFSDDEVKLTQFQTIKGLVYVGLTALLLFILIKGYYKTICHKVEELEEVNKKLEESNRELEQFASVASHDLQEPLRMVSSFLTQLQRKYQGQLDEKAQQYIYYAVDGSKRMQQMITDLLRLSRSGLNEEQKETVDLNKIIEKFCELRHEQLDAENATILYEGLPTIYTYISPLKQIIHNILDNALKYKRENEPARVEISVTDTNNHWQFAIKDNGIGIKSDAYDKIFVIFQRLHNKEVYGGSGLGLAIVKKNVAALNGKIWLTSKPNEGSTFYFTIKK